MNILKFKLLIITGFILVLTTSLRAQIKVSEVVQTSKITASENNKLFFVDFWATWCGPCIHAKKYLTVIQKQFKNDLYIISLSEENTDQVSRFLRKTPTELTVAMDYYGQTFKTFNITSLPNGILFNAKGKKLWEGHPADLKPELLNRFLRQNSATANFEDFVSIISEEDEVNTDYVPKEQIEFKLIASSSEDLAVVDADDFLKLTGKLSDVLSYMSHIYSKQIMLPQNLNSTYEVYVKKPYTSSDNISYKIVDKLGYTISTSQNEGEVYKLTINSPNFWDTNQIDWGDDAPPYLVSDSDITADDYSLKDLSYQLSKALDVPVIITDEDAKSYKKHDWQVHYKFFELMQSNLADYGISIQKEKSSYPIYTITKKAP